jgi:WD40-like Beta Propeller Repeat
MRHQGYLTVATSKLVAAALACWICSVATARAAVTHEFLPAVTSALSGGVPAGQPVPGPLGGVEAMAADGGEVWVAERIQSGPFLSASRVDAFDASSGSFIAPQLAEEGGVSELDQGVAAGGVMGEERVYVSAVHEGKAVVAVFDPATGELLGTWTGANTPGGVFSDHGSLGGVAVDTAMSSETVGDVYVAVAGFLEFPGTSAVDLLAPLAGGAEPPSVVAELKGTCAVEGTTCAGEEVSFGAPSGVAVSGFNGNVLVTDERRVVDVFEPVGAGAYRFLRQLKGTPTGPGGEEVGFKRVTAVAADAGTGNVYVLDSPHAVDEFGPAGEYLGRLTGVPTGRPGEFRPFASAQSVAVDTASHRVFVGDYDSDRGGGVVDVFGPDIEIPDVTTGPPGEVTVACAEEVSGACVGRIKATLNGTVNPREQGEASCAFAWGESPAFGQSAPCEPEQVANGASPVPVHAMLVDLQPDTTYTYRLQASDQNGINPGEVAQDHVVSTPGPGLHGAWVTRLSSTSATLNAAIDPHGATTSAYFEYGKSAQYEAQTPVAPGASLGSGEADAPLERRLQGLDAGATYHYRAVAVAQLETAPGVLRPVLFHGPDRAFRTQGEPVHALPDGRRWELVSPPDKHGALMLGITASGVIQAAASGESLAYLATLPTEEGVGGYSEAVQILSNRGPQGWSSRNITTPHAGATGSNTGHGPEYKFFSDDLSLALAEPSGPFTSLAPYAFPPDTERTPYLRHDSTCEALPLGCFEPLLTGAPGYADVPEGTEFGGSVGRVGEANFVGATPDLAHVLLSSRMSLTTTPTGSVEELYEFSADAPYADRLQLVSVLPGGEGPATASARLGQENEAARGAVSDDGSRVVWTSGDHLYMRDMARGRTAQLDAIQPGVPLGFQPSARFQIASGDGARVFFTDEQRLTEDSGGLHGSADLYACDMVEVGVELRCDLSDLTPVREGESAGVRGGLLGASEDGSYVYFVASGVLSSTPNALHEEARSGANNLYELHYDGVAHAWEQPVFIARLSSDDGPDWSSVLSTKGQTARVSPDGRWLAFMSSSPLTGYDNRDANSGQPDEEVFLFHADDGALLCASCDPTGARPVGVEAGKLLQVVGVSIWEAGVWLAGNIPAWTPYELSRARHQSRYLSNSGRLFFNSSDALVPEDVNGNEDVYQYEPTAVGDCTGALATFHTVTGGCVSLISSGTAAGESAFLDASDDGDDVFFLSGERLAPEDEDTAIDVYDAHACRSSAPCLSRPTPPPACSTADSCRDAPVPQPSIFGAPSSATFSGAGNLHPAAPTPKPAPETRAQRLVRALKVCRAKRNHRKRAKCERQARRRFKAKHTGKGSKARGRRR